MSIICNVSIKDENSKKDPTSPFLPQETIKKYINRKMSQDFAQHVLARYNGARLISRINKLAPEKKSEIITKIQPYRSDVNEGNVGKIVNELLYGSISDCAGKSVPIVPVNTKSDELKKKHGIYLLSEAEYTCIYPGCGVSLVSTGNGQTVYTYEVCKIDDSAAEIKSNLVALCPACYAKYMKKPTKVIQKRILANKRAVSDSRNWLSQTDDIRFDEGIADVVIKISKLKNKDLVNEKMDPKEVCDKISPQDNPVLYKLVFELVTTYYYKVKRIFESLHKQKKVDYKDVQIKMAALYNKLNSPRKSKEEVFYAIVDKVRKATLQDEHYCQVVVAFFIQKCEVFDANP